MKVIYEIKMIEVISRRILHLSIQVEKMFHESINTTINIRWISNFI